MYIIAIIVIHLDMCA